MTHVGHQESVSVRLRSFCGVRCVLKTYIVDFSEIKFFFVYFRDSKVYQYVLLNQQKDRPLSKVESHGFRQELFQKLDEKMLISAFEACVNISELL